MSMLGGDLATALPALQQQAESLLTDSCNLQRKGSQSVDANTGMVTDSWTTYRSAVPCRVRASGIQPEALQVAGQDITRIVMTVAVAVAVDDVEVDDRVVVTVSRDTSLIGLALYVVGVPRGSQMVLRRLSVTEAQ